MVLTDENSGKLIQRLAKKLDRLMSITISEAKSCLVLRQGLFMTTRTQEDRLIPAFRRFLNKLKHPEEEDIDKSTIFGLKVSR